MNLWIFFLTGLTTGGLSCLAVQGGLLASVITNQKIQDAHTTHSKKEYVAVGLFLLAKLISHALLGLLLGFLGEKISLSLGVKLTFQAFTALFMFATAMNLLQVHPLFRFVFIQPPRFIRKMVKVSSKSSAFFAPVFLGFLTVFIPCGVTQAMQVLAINSADPIQAMLIMVSFTLGTFPLFGLIGVATTKLSELWYANFTKIASYLLIIMSLYSLNGVLVVLNAPVTLNSIVRPITYFFSDERFSQTTLPAPLENGVQKVSIEALNSGSSPEYIAVKSGVPVELTVFAQEVYSCAVDFRLQEFGVAVFLKPNTSQTFEFTPLKKGRFVYSCSMGMYSGILEVL